jgi:regulator of sigma E protease
MHLLIAIIGAIVAIFSVIILHELGHYVVARLFGIKILRFSIGFGKALWKRTSKSGTEYIFALLPLGGYVKMLGEGEEVTSAEDMTRAYNRKPVLVRMAVVIAGPIVNFLIAVIAFWGVYLMGVDHIKPVVGNVIPHSIAAQAGLKRGDEVITVDGAAAYNWQRVMMALVSHVGSKRDMVLTIKPVNSTQVQTRILVLRDWKIDQRNPDFFRSIGVFPFQPKAIPVIAKVMPNSPSAAAGLLPNDRIIAINGKPINDWGVLVETVRKLPHQQVLLTIMRNQQRQNINVQVGTQTQGNQTVGYLGIISMPPQWPANQIHTEKYSVFQAWGPALSQTWMMTKFNCLVLVKMISGKISIHTLGGPVTVFQAAGEATLAGFQVYLGFIGFISLTIGFINLLPIPGLDGGHLLFQIIEGIFRRPVPERIQMIGLSIGMVFLIFLMVQATINDLMRLFFHA